MATILNKLPPELRNQIYRELLVDVRCIRITKDWNAAFFEPEPLCPAILRVCKQVYLEASPILYGGNKFYFSEPDYLADLRKSILFPLLGKGAGEFKRIKHLEFEFHAAYLGFESTPLVLNETISIMRLIAKTGCSLNTLRLSWKHRYFHYSVSELDPPPFLFGRDEDVLRAIASLKVQKKIEITVDRNDAGHYSTCKAFTSKVGSFMQWLGMNVTKMCIKRSFKAGVGIREEVQDFEEENLINWSKHENFTDGTSGDSDIAEKELWNDVGIRYIWTWTLAPTATMLKDEGFKTAKSMS